MSGSVLNYFYLRHGANNLAIVVIVAQTEVVLKDFKIDTDLLTKLTLKMNIVNKIVGFRIQR